MLSRWSPPRLRRGHAQLALRGGFREAPRVSPAAALAARRRARGGAVLPLAQPSGDRRDGDASTANSNPPPASCGVVDGTGTSTSPAQLRAAARALRRVRPGREHVPTDRVARRRLAQPVERIRRPRMGGVVAWNPRRVGRRKPRRARKPRRQKPRRRKRTPRRSGCLATCRVLGRVGRDDGNVGFVAPSRVVRASPASPTADRNIPGWWSGSGSAGAAVFMRWEVDVLRVVARWRRCARRRTRCRPGGDDRNIPGSTCPPGPRTRGGALRAADAARDAAAEVAWRTPPPPRATRTSPRSPRSSTRISSRCCISRRSIRCRYVRSSSRRRSRCSSGSAWDGRFFVKKKVRGSIHERRDTAGMIDRSCDARTRGEGDGARR